MIESLSMKEEHQVPYFPDNVVFDAQVLEQMVSREFISQIARSIPSMVLETTDAALAFVQYSLRQLSRHQNASEYPETSNEVVVQLTQMGFLRTFVERVFHDIDETVLIHPCIFWCERFLKSILGHMYLAGPIPSRTSRNSAQGSITIRSVVTPSTNIAIPYVEVSA
jgi:hypothetical protein